MECVSCSVARSCRGGPAVAAVMPRMNEKLLGSWKREAKTKKGVKVLWAKKERVRRGDVAKEEKAMRWDVNGGTITQSELKIFDNSSGNQLSSETDVSRLMFEPTHALRGMPTEISVLIIKDTSEDWTQGKGT